MLPSAITMQASLQQNGTYDKVAKGVKLNAKPGA